MCPICLTSLAVTVATTTGAGATVTAVALGVRRSITRNQKHPLHPFRTKESE